MTPVTSTVPSATARRRSAAHRAAEGTVTAYLRELSAAAHPRREAAFRRDVISPTTCRR